ncbi:MAG TPA: ROK family protein [Spirochaetia bacterium]|nr:ROK family protein [Spirochaetia bacterium]
MRSRTGRDVDVATLQAIYALGTPTRNEIARLTNQSAVSVTKSLARLIPQGLAERCGKRGSKAGRPTALYGLGRAAGYSVGISIDVAGFRLTAIDVRHELLLERGGVLSLSADPSLHAEEIVSKVTAELRSFVAATELADRRLVAVGIAPPGIVDTQKGIWLHGLRITGVLHVALGEAFRRLFGVSVLVEDAARCLAYEEAARRPRDDARNLVYFYLGSGVGAGIIIDGKPFHGCRGMAGEVGHLIVEEAGIRCSCGNVGCLETVISSSAVLNRFRERLSQGVISSLQRFRDDGRLSLQVIKDAADEGDKLARSTLFELGRFLGDAVSKVIKLFNPRELIIGGPVALLGEHIRESLWIELRQKVMPEMLVDLSLEMSPTKVGDETLGAAMLAERHFWKHTGGADMPSLFDQRRPRDA